MRKIRSCVDAGSAYSLLTLLPHSSFLPVILSPSVQLLLLLALLPTPHPAVLHTPEEKVPAPGSAWSCTQADELAGRSWRVLTADVTARNSAAKRTSFY